MARLDGEVAVVTGGGRGIGRAIAVALASEGARVALCARTTEELEESARAVAHASPTGVAPLALPCDVARDGDVARFAESVLRLGTPRVVVNNAGIVLRGRLDEQDPADWLAVVDVNLHGTYRVTRAFLPAMRAARRGRVVNVSSISGTLGTPRLTAYCAAKHAVNGLTRALAEELREEGVQVMAVCPGSVDTRMLVGSGFDPAMSAGDVAGVVRYLACEAPDAMTGSIVECFG